MTVQNLLVPASCGETVKEHALSTRCFYGRLLCDLASNVGTRQFCIPTTSYIINFKDISMNKIYILFLCLCYPVSAIMANTYKNDKEVTSPTDANILGHVVDKATGEHLPGITIILKGTTIGSVTDDSGHYMLKNLPEGEFTIEVSFVGFKTVTKKVTTGKGKTQELNFELEEDLISLEGVVVSANRNETKRRLAPTLVKVLSPTVFEKTNSTTLAQGLVFQPGVRVENDCQNCGYSQVRINGMEGKYTQILIDSRPIFSALAGVYGLEQIPANMIERVEVIRGGGSALFGSSAIAGTINIITKEPHSQFRFLWTYDF